MMIVKAMFHDVVADGIWEFETANGAEGEKEWSGALDVGEVAPLPGMSELGWGEFHGGMLFHDEH